MHALSKTDMGSLAFFIGIFLSVATLEHTHPDIMALWLDQTVGRQNVW